MQKSREAIDAQQKATTKHFNGKAIYNPSGKAGEYSYWACNFYRGCSNNCSYCYLKKGVMAHNLGGTKVQLKSCFKSPEHAIEVFRNELMKNLPDLQKHGLFFSFTTDPMLEETIDLTVQAVSICQNNKVPVKILTKTAWWLDNFHPSTEYVAFGFTLTGCDELEPGANSNKVRIEAMKELHNRGYKTFASIEPIIDLNLSLDMIKEVIFSCNLFKIGLLSGKKYVKDDLLILMHRCAIAHAIAPETKFYFKDSFLSQAGITKDYKPESFVNRDYNIFTGK